MADEIRAGDAVQHKTGGPRMIVDKLYPDYDLPSAYCSWFDEKNAAQGQIFPLTTLKKV